MTLSTIEIDTLYKEYSAGLGNSIVAVDGIDLEIRKNEFLTLVGPSGCGKTTTLRCVAGLETPTEGEIRFDNQDVTDVPANKRNLAMMFQNIALYPHMKVKDNIAYPLKVDGVGEGTQYEEAERAAEIMQIPELLEKYPGELSGGQRQRAALARTIVQKPYGFLMDEPLSDLDAKLKVEIRKEIQRVHKRIDKPMVYVTHDQEEAMTMSDRIAVMNNGRIEQVGTPEELYHYPSNVFVAEFIGNPSMNFLTGVIESISDEHARVTIRDRIFEFTPEYVRDMPIDEKVRIGFRPESVNAISGNGNGDLSGTVQLLERIGDRLLASIEGPEGEIRATVADSHDLAEDEPVTLTVDRSGLYLFHPESKEVVAKGR